MTCFGSDFILTKDEVDIEMNHFENLDYSGKVRLTWTVVSLSSLW